MPRRVNPFGIETRQYRQVNDHTGGRDDLDVEPSDEALMAAIGTGDRHALRVLYERHSPWLFLRLLRRRGDRDLVEEVVQDTFMVIWRKPQAYRGGGAVPAWIWGIGIRRLLDSVRRVSVVERVRERFSSGDAGPVASAEESVLMGVEYGDLGTALDRLSPELQEVLRAAVLDGLTSRECARLLGIPEGTVKTRLMRARQQLRRELA